MKKKAKNPELNASPFPCPLCRGFFNTMHTFGVCVVAKDFMTVNSHYKVVCDNCNTSSAEAERPEVALEGWMLMPRDDLTAEERKAALLAQAIEETQRAEEAAAKPEPSEELELEDIEDPYLGGPPVKR